MEKTVRRERDGGASARTRHSLVLQRRGGARPLQCPRPRGGGEDEDIKQRRRWRRGVCRNTVHVHEASTTPWTHSLQGAYMMWV